MAKPDKKNDARKVAVYVRKSKITETGKSIEIQKEKCAALALAQFEAEKADILFYEDEGKSGFYADRPQYMKMLADIERNKIKAVVCYKIDRVSRRTVDLLNLVQQMDRKGIAFVSVSDRDIDTSTRTGKIMISLLAAIAEFERDIIAERIADNMYELAKDGRWLGGECPLGYSSRRVDRANRLEAMEAEQITVRKIFSEFLKTHSLTGTADALNTNGLKTKKGRGFSPTAVKNILQNPVYAVADSDMRTFFDEQDVVVWAEESAFDGTRGVMAYNKTAQTKEMDMDSTALDPKYNRRTLKRDMNEWVVSVGEHKGIVDGGEWVRVQKIICGISAGFSARSRNSSKSLLSGLVRCSVCGGKMLARTNSGRFYADGSLRFSYICADKYRHGSDVCKNSKNYSGKELDALVFKEICSLADGEHLSPEEIAEIKKSLGVKSNGGETVAAGKRLARIEAEIQNQIASLRQAPESIKPAIFADIEALNREREKIRCKAVPPKKKPQDDSAAESLAEILRLASYWEKLRLVKNAVEFVMVEDEAAHVYILFK